MSRKISFWILLGVIFLLAIVFLRVMASFLIPMFLAAILCVMFGPIHVWIYKKVGQRPKTAALLTTGTIMLVVLVPMVILITLAIFESREIVSKLDANTIKGKAEKVRTSLKLDLPYKDDFENVEAHLDKLTSGVNPDTWQQKQLELTYLERASKNFIDHWEQDPNRDEDRQTKNAVAGLIEKYQKQLENCNKQLIILVSDSSDTEKKVAAESDYRTSLEAMNQSYRDLKTKILGGRFWATVRELANPTPEESAEYNAKIQALLTKWVLALGSATTSLVGRLIFGISIMIISTYFFFLDGRKMIESIKFLSPMDDAHEDELLAEFNKVSRAVVIATLLSAVVQGFLAGLGYYFCGVGSVFLLTLLTTVFALIPFVGATAIWLPAALWLYFIDGSPVYAIILGIYGAAVVSTADNVIKPFILHGQSNIHPLLALLSVLGGVSTLGPIGILVGPMIVVFLQTLLKILQRELSTLDDEEAATAGGGEPAAET